MRMKPMTQYCVLVLCIGLLTGSAAQVISAKQGPPKTPPGQAKKESVPPGQAKKQDIPGTQPGQPGSPGGIGMAKVRGGAKEIDLKVWQAWCLQHEGNVNMVLPDNSICDCLTKTHAIAFASEESWLEAIGKSLHGALTTGKEPAIVVFIQQDEEQSYILQLNAIIKHFKLPIFLWEEVLTIEKETTP